MSQFLKIKKTSVCVIPESYPLRKTSEGFDRSGAFFKTIKFRILNFKYLWLDFEPLPFLISGGLRKPGFGHSELQKL